MKTKTAPKSATVKHSTLDPRVPPFSREMLKSTIHSGNKESFVFDAAKNLRLRILADMNDCMILKDEYGNFYCDRAILTDTREISDAKNGEYWVLRQRQQVSPGFALEILMSTAIPRELLDQMPQLPKRIFPVRPANS